MRSIVKAPMPSPLSLTTDPAIIVITNLKIQGELSWPFVRGDPHRARSEQRFKKYPTPN